MSRMSTGRLTIFLVFAIHSEDKVSTVSVHSSFSSIPGWLILRGGSPDLSSDINGQLIASQIRAEKGLTVGVRNGKYTVLTPKQKAELMVMGSNPAESRKILEVLNIISAHISRNFTKKFVSITPPLPPFLSLSYFSLFSLPVSHPPSLPPYSPSLRLSLSHCFTHASYPPAPSVPAACTAAEPYAARCTSNTYC